MQFSEDLIGAFDADGDAESSLDFEEFFELYVEHFAPNKLSLLRRKVVEGYLTGEELEALRREQAAMEEARRRKEQLLDMRSHIKARQAEQFQEAIVSGRLGESGPIPAGAWVNVEMLHQKRRRGSGV